MNCMEKWWENWISKLTIDKQPIDDIYLPTDTAFFIPL